jgi:hypothetical protein
VQRAIHLTGAQDDTLNLLGRVDSARLVRRVGNDPPELRVPDELLDVGARERMAQQGLGKEKDESWIGKLALKC